MVGVIKAVRESLYRATKWVWLIQMSGYRLYLPTLIKQITGNVFPNVAKRPSDDVCFVRQFRYLEGRP